MMVEDVDRLDIEHALLESVDQEVDDHMSDDERARLNASLDRSIAQADAGQTVPFEEVMAALYAKRAMRAAR